MRDEPLSKRALGRWPGIFGGTRRSFPSASQQAWALSDVRRQGPLSLRRPGRPGNLDLQPLWGWRWPRAGSAISQGGLQVGGSGGGAAYACG